MILTRTNGSFLLRQSVSLYFHVPFCRKKCGYCHFYVIPDKPPFIKDYMEGLKLEWERWKLDLLDKEIETIYFGGGTPALIGPDLIAKILQWTRQVPWKSQDIEITLEANPEGIDASSIKGFAKAGINRISVGVQSLDDSLLHTLTRTHDAGSAKEAVRLIKRSGIDNISVDLMYDLPGQTMGHWQHTLEEALSLPITHLSLYNLVFEPHTSFFKQKEKLQMLLPKEEISSEMYLEAISQCRKAEFTQYEISAFQRGDCISRHNTGYWLGRPFLGFGPSAFSYWKGKRFRNVSNLSRYVKALKKGESPVDFEEELEAGPRLKELLAINLRLIEGVHLKRFQEKHGMLEDDVLNALEMLSLNGFLVHSDGTFKLTQKGMLFYDSLASEII